MLTQRQREKVHYITDFNEYLFKVYHNEYQNRTDEFYRCFVAGLDSLGSKDV